MIISLSWTTLQAADFYVNSTTDAVDNDLNDGVCLTADGVCSFRAAVMQANYSVEADVITVQPGFYSLSIPRTEDGGWDGELNDAKGDLDIFESVTIQGEDPTSTDVWIIGASGLQDRLIHIKGSDAPGQYLEVNIAGIGLYRGSQKIEPNGGGAVLIASSRSGLGSPPHVTFKNVSILASHSPYTGSGLSNWGGTVLIEDSIIYGNQSGYIRNNTSGWQDDPDRESMLSGGGLGGGIGHWAGEMTIRRSIVSENAAQMGGGIYTQDTFPVSTLLIEDSEVSENLAFMGGGIASYAGITASEYGVTIARSTLSDNMTELSGGGIYNIGSMLISNSTLSGNSAWDLNNIPNYPTKGGGIFHGGRLLDIVSSTIAGNESRDLRTTEAITDDAMGGDEIFFDHLNNRGAGSSSTLFDRRFSIQGSIIGDGPPTDPLDPAFGTDADDNCNGPIGYQDFVVSLGGNTASGTTCFPPSLLSSSRAFTISSTGDVYDASPEEMGLGELQDNGGTVVLPDGAGLETRALSDGSVAVGNAGECPGSDQRSFARQGACDSGAFQVEVDETATGNALPVADDDIASVDVGQQIDIPVLNNDRDPDVTDVLEVASLSAVSVGSVSILENGVVRYSAPSSEEAPAELPVEVTFTYSLSDGANETSGNVTVWLYAVDQNTAPVGVEDEYTVGEGQSIYLDVLANDSDADEGDNGRLAIYSEEAGSTSTQTTTITTIGNNTRTTTNTNTNTITDTNASADIATPGGNLRLLNNNTIFLYTPNDGFVGVDEFTYDVIDPRGLMTTEVAVRVTINRTPEITDESIQLAVDAGEQIVSSVSATDFESDELDFMGVDGAKGHVEISNDGSFIYTADAEASGEDEFTVFVSDGMSTSNIIAKVLINPGLNTAPVGVEDVHDILAGQPYDVNVIANDTDVNPADGGNLIISGDPVVVSVIGGSISKLSDTTVRFTPDAGFFGQYQFTYVVEDPQGAKSSPVLVTLDIREENNAPEFYQSTYHVYVESGETYSGQVKAKDVDGDTIRYAVNEGSLGEVTYNEVTGQFSYKAGDDLGTETIQVVAEDSFGESTANLIIKVQAKASSALLSSTGGDSDADNSDGGGGAFNVYLLAVLMGFTLLLRGVRRQN